MKGLTMALALGLAIGTASCSDNDDDKGGNHNRDIIIGFENVPSNVLAGPTSYGDNLYSTYTDGTQFVSYSNEYLQFGVNKGFDFTTQQDNVPNFFNGGVALSNWCIRTSPSGKPQNWWYTYENQCSVYNSDISATKTQGGAGHDGSDIFAIVFDKATISFARPVKLVKLYYALTAYTYGFLKNGGYGVSGSLESEKGYFAVTATFKDKDGTVITTRTKILADYRTGHEIEDPDDDWDDWEVDIDNVSAIDFAFEGSQVNEYGLLTPGYLAIDDITIR